MSRSTVRYLILSHGEKKKGDGVGSGGEEKSPPTYANAAFAAPFGRDAQCRAARSLREVSGRGGRVEAFPGRC